MRFKDLTGNKYGRLTVLKRVEDAKNGAKRWLCKCDCGNEKIVRASNLISGSTKSCGCLQKENGIKRGKSSASHGMCGTHIYRVYRQMISRCYNPKKDGYKRYGGRGISVCNEWLGENGFINFYNWSLENGYDESLQIDRIDNNGNYSPDNCRWVTAKENMRNRSVNHFIDTPFGRITIAEFAEEINADYDLIYTQVWKGLHTIEWIADHYKDTKDSVSEKYKRRIKKEIKQVG